mmetsp:Transcript_7151/g.13094  ORF Transcript_7151/g.13094 Transcript_7151/m.13094 type:complete len:201 (+) Transcript_7151:951-1553(+)
MSSLSMDSLFLSPSSLTSAKVSSLSISSFLRSIIIWMRNISLFFSTSLVIFSVVCTLSLARAWWAACATSAIVSFLGSSLAPSSSISSILRSAPTRLCLMPFSWILRFCLRRLFSLSRSFSSLTFKILESGGITKGFPSMSASNIEALMGGSFCAVLKAELAVFKLRGASRLITVNIWQSTARSRSQLRDSWLGFALTSI